MIFRRHLARAGHTRRFQISSGHGVGWDVLEEEDDRIVRAIKYDDWHRVERIRGTFELEVCQLQQNGWTET